jgi:hypothetical protein
MDKNSPLSHKVSIPSLPFSVKKPQIIPSKGDIAYSFRIVKHDKDCVIDKCIATIVEQKLLVEIEGICHDARTIAKTTHSIDGNSAYRVFSQMLENTVDGYVFLVVLRNKSHAIKTLFMRMAFNKMKNNQRVTTSVNLMETMNLSNDEQSNPSLEKLSDDENDVVNTLLEFKQNKPSLEKNKMKQLPPHILFGNVGNIGTPIISTENEPAKQANVNGDLFHLPTKDISFCIPTLVEAFPKQFEFYFPIENDVDIELMKSAPTMEIIHLEKENQNHIILTYSRNDVPVVLNYLLPIRLDGKGARVTVYFDEKTKCNILNCFANNPYQIPQVSQTSKYSTRFDETTNEHLNIHEVTVKNFDPQCLYSYEYDEQSGIIVFIVPRVSHTTHSFRKKFSSIKYRLSVDIGKMQEIKNIKMEALMIEQRMQVIVEITSITKSVVQKQNARKIEECETSRKKPRVMDSDTTDAIVPPHIQLLNDVANGKLSANVYPSEFTVNMTQLTGIAQQHPSVDTLKQCRINMSNKLFATKESCKMGSFCKGIFMNQIVNMPTNTNAFELSPTVVMVDKNIHVRGLLSKQLAILYGGIHHVKSYLRGCTLHISVLYKNHYINNVFVLSGVSFMESYEMAELSKYDTFEYIVIIKPFSRLEITTNTTSLPVETDLNCSNEYVIGSILCNDSTDANPVTP